jgi:hypothetical protein
MDDRCWCAEPELEELAWAAGFFDGEGTTIARTDSDRPGYHQLQITVPQCGRDGVPGVLLRFQRAVLGMGFIEPPDKRAVYRWRARGFVDAQATIALLWCFLGPVKRAQATTALRTVVGQYRTGLYVTRGPRAPEARTPHAPHPPPARVDGQELELAWAAGLFDAEGWFGLKRSRSRIAAPDWYRLRASVSQHGQIGHSPAVLVRFADAVGTGRIERHGEADDFKWVCERFSEIGSVVDALARWLSPAKRGQAHAAFDRFRQQVRVHGDNERCARGHLYDAYRMSTAGMRHVCNACARRRDRAKRAARGIAPRQFKNVARRYNS